MKTKAKESWAIIALTTLRTFLILVAVVITLFTIMDITNGNPPQDINEFNYPVLDN